jgi:branched-chain amino acid transport system permease protein
MKLLELLRFENTTRSKISLAAVAGIVAIVLTLPFWGTAYAVMVVTLMGIYITLGQMWNLLAGYSGLVSLGLQMYIGVGAFTLAIFSDTFGMPLLLSLFMSGVVSTIIAVGLSYLLLRMRGMYFAIATWMFSQAMVLVIVQFEFFGKGQGLFVMAGRGMSDTTKYYFSIIMLLAVVLLVILLLRSKLGLGLFAIRDNDTASQTCGVPLFKSKLLVMMITAFVTGVCGGVYYIIFVWIQPYSAFSILSWTVPAVFIVVIGGIGTITGPLVGGVIYVFLSQYLATLSQIGSLNMVILGVIAVAVILAAPKGIVGTLQNRFGFEIISARRWMKTYTNRLPDPAPMA